MTSAPYFPSNGQSECGKNLPRRSRNVAEVAQNAMSTEEPTGDRSLWLTRWACLSQRKVNRSFRRDLHIGAFQMRRRYLQTVSTVAIGSFAFGTAVTEKADAQDAGFTLTFTGGVGDANGQNFDSGGYSNPDNGGFGAVMISRQMGNMEGYARISLYNQDSNSVESGFSSGSGFGVAYGREFTKSASIEAGVVRPTTQPGLSLGFGARMLRVQHGIGVGAEGVFASGGGPFSGGFVGSTEYGVRSTFLGIGPRVSLHYSTAPVVGQFGFSAEAGLSALFGKKEQEVYGEIDYFGYEISNSSGFSESNFLAAIDLSAQADYYISDNTKVFAGVKIDNYLDLADGSDDSNVRTTTFFTGLQSKF